ncbi:rhodanese-like domain-containing protein [Ottowia sp. VDI28]|uniref:rhodanese-like domain-containing protein n=1 Tax=Ottowia sp. VDI28 TaxID=3133968 RepID=UPI003C2F21DF
MTAHWLRQMGWQADVLDPATAPDLAPSKPSNPEWIREPAGVAQMSAPEMWTAMQGDPGIAVIDCSSSIAFRKAHIAGAWYCARACLADGLKALPSHVSTLIFTANEAALARFAAADALALGWQVQVLEGGNTSWRSAGLPMEKGAHRQLSPPNDVWYSPYEVEPERQESAMREYIDWEIGLASRLAREPGVHFQVLRAE